MYEDSLVVRVISEILKKDATSEERNLKSLYVDVRSVCAPCVCSDGVGHEGTEQAVEVEEEEYGQDTTCQKLNEKDPETVSEAVGHGEIHTYQLKLDEFVNGWAVSPPPLAIHATNEQQLSLQDHAGAGFARLR